MFPPVSIPHRQQRRAGRLPPDTGGLIVHKAVVFERFTNKLQPADVYQVRRRLPVDALPCRQRLCCGLPFGPACHCSAACRAVFALKIARPVACPTMSAARREINALRLALAGPKRRLAATPGAVAGVTALGFKCLLAVLTPVT